MASASDFVTPSLLIPAMRNDLSMRALETISASLSRIDLAPTVLYDFDTVDVSALPVLAEQFNVLGDAGWDMADTEAKKRALLKEAIALHRIKGTPYAIKRALKLLGVNVLLSEWFETVPRGRPHTFFLDAWSVDQSAGNPSIDSALAEKIKRVVTFWKPVRSHFLLNVGLSMTTSLQIGSVFSGKQYLRTQGTILPTNLNAATVQMSLHTVSIFSCTQMLQSNGTIR